MQKSRLQQRGDRIYAGFFVSSIFSIVGLTLGCKAKDLSARSFSQNGLTGVEWSQQLQSFWTNIGLTLFVGGLVLFILVFSFWLHQENSDE